MAEPTQRYRYDIRYFRVEDGSFHECTGNVIDVLQSSYNVNRKSWYLTVLVQTPVDKITRESREDKTPWDW